MTSDFVPLETPSAPVECQSQIRLKNEEGKLLIILPVETPKPIDWASAWQDLKFRFQGNRSWQSATAVHLIAQDQLLDGRQLQTLAQLLQEVHLRLERICTSRRQTAVAAAMAGYSVDQELPNLASGLKPPSLDSEPLYLQATIRSGMEVRHPGPIVIVGDVNPGGSLIAAGDILVWGCLRGIAHAGAQGDRTAKIMALRMEPTQLRIASVVARAPEAPPGQVEPEVAYVSAAGIRIAKALNFAKSLVFQNG
ncbi:MAG: septum site-determining protein MinC [Cyanophyceae cyanobacterium]